MMTSSGACRTGQGLWYGSAYTSAWYSWCGPLKIAYVEGHDGLTITWRNSSGWGIRVISLAIVQSQFQEVSSTAEHRSVFVGAASSDAGSRRLCSCRWLGSRSLLGYATEGQAMRNSLAMAGSGLWWRNVLQLSAWRSSPTTGAE